MIKNIFYKVTGDPNEKEIKRLQPIVEEINELEPEYQKLSDEELAHKTEEFRGFHRDRYRKESRTGRAQNVVVERSR